MREIIDKFTNLPVSRQRKNQLRRQALGLCIDAGCNNPAPTTAVRCDDHAEADAIRKRNLYRLRHGIPLGAPPYTRAKKK